MHEEPYLLVPLFGRQGVRGHSKLDPVDAHLSAYRWHLASGYAARLTDEGHLLSLHRAVMGLGYGDGGEVDHFNRDKLDNRRANLRVADRRLNCLNVSARGGTSRFRAVYWARDRNRWRACIRMDGQKYHLGSFGDELEAAAAVEAFRAARLPEVAPDPAYLAR